MMIDVGFDRLSWRSIRQAQESAGQSQYRMVTTQFFHPTPAVFRLCSLTLAQWTAQQPTAMGSQPGVPAPGI